MNQTIKEFEHMIDFAELKALSNHSIEHPLTDDQYSRLIELKNKIFGGENAKVKTSQ